MNVPTVPGRFFREDRPMAEIRPFACIRPCREKAEKIAALPYDVYNRKEAKEEVFRKYYKSLASKGVLFIGSTEQIINYREIGYERMNSFYYQKP